MTEQMNSLFEKQLLAHSDVHNFDKDSKDVKTDNFIKKVLRVALKNWGFILLYILTFTVVAGIVYFDANTTEIFFSYNDKKMEVGRIYLGDKDIVAPRSMPADAAYPIDIEEGEVIQKVGTEITENAILKIKKISDSPVIVDYRVFCNRLLYLLLLSALWIVIFNPIILGRKLLVKEAILETVLFVFVFFVAAFADKATFFQSPFALSVVIPSAFSAFLVSILFGQHSAYLFSAVMGLGVLGAADFHIVPMIFTIATGVSASRIVRSIEKRIDLVFAGLIQALLACVFELVLKVIFNGDMKDAPFVFPGIAFNGFISGILVLGLLTPLEYIMNTASVFRLMDLSDQNAAVLRKMLVVAGGTYSHSMMVGTLAENACKAIGANPLLARVGAYYHDVGKMEQPEYFTENSQSGHNPHDDISPELSALIIKRHVQSSLEKAKQLRLPKQVVDIIGEHHGNSVIAFFYNKALQIAAKTHGGDTSSVSLEDFTYPGRPPVTKESAVVMLADTVEAACRSLDNPTPENIEKFIAKLIAGKIEGHQLDNCHLTFGELTLIKNAFLQILVGHYHTRVKYPNQKDPDADSKDSKAEETKSIEAAEDNSEKEEKAESESSEVEKKDEISEDSKNLLPESAEIVPEKDESDDDDEKKKTSGILIVDQKDVEGDDSVSPDDTTVREEDDKNE